MVIEDAGNPSHRISHWMDALGIPFPTTPRLIVFLPIAAIFFSALLFHRSVLRESRAAYLFFLGGFIFYGVAVIWSLSIYTIFPGSLPREEIGLWVHTEILNGVLLHDDLEAQYLSWQMADYVLEESLEFFGATAFLGGSVSLFQSIIAKRPGSVRGALN